MAAVMKACPQSHRRYPRVLRSPQSPTLPLTGLTLGEIFRPSSRRLNSGLPRVAAQHHGSLPATAPPRTASGPPQTGTKFQEASPVNLRLAHNQFHLRPANPD